MLTIKEFVKTTLVELSEGIREANEAVKGSGHEFAPLMGKRVGLNEAFEKDSEIHFDLAVTTTKGAKGGGGLHIAYADIIDVEVGGKGNYEASAISRVQFSINAFFHAGDCFE